MKEYGKEWSDKPNDLLQWCMDKGRENSVDQLAVRMMAIKFAAIQVRVYFLVFMRAFFRLENVQTTSNVRSLY